MRKEPLLGEQHNGGGGGYMPRDKEEVVTGCPSYHILFLYIDEEPRGSISANEFGLNEWGLGETVLCECGRSQLRVTVCFSTAFASS